MDSRRLIRSSPLAAAALASAVLLCGARSSAAERSERSPREEPDRASLEGTWRVKVTQVNCTTGLPLGDPFRSLVTYARGGTATETTASPAFFPLVRGPGHGVWSEDGERSYRVATTAFITKDGALVRTQTITQEIEMKDADGFFSSASVEFFDPSGALLIKGCATAIGERFQ